MKKGLYLKKYIKANKELFKPGTYVIDHSLSYYVKIEERDYYSNIFNDKFMINSSFFQKIKNFVKLLIYFVYIALFSKTIELSFEKGGVNDCILLTYKERSLKMFSKDKKIITTIYNDLEIYEEYIDTRNIFENYFKMPSLLSTSTDNLLTTERFKKYKQSQELTESNKEEVISSLLDSMTKLSERTSYKYEVKKYNNVSYPIINIHGDLYIKNILYNEDNVYFIDFGNEKNYFIYDFFFFIIIEAFKNKNPYYIKNYFNGKYDDKLEYIYNKYHLIYDVDNKMSHIKTFLYFKNDKSGKKLINKISKEYENYNSIV